MIISDYRLSHLVGYWVVLPWLCLSNICSSLSLHHTHTHTLSHTHTHWCLWLKSLPLIQSAMASIIESGWQVLSSPPSFLAFSVIITSTSSPSTETFLCCDSFYKFLIFFQIPCFFVRTHKVIYVDMSGFIVRFK